MSDDLWEMLGIAEPDPDEIVVDCDSCGLTRRYGDRLDWPVAPCINGLCRVWSCATCGAVQMADGPIMRGWNGEYYGCHCELGGPNPLAINGRAYRRRIRNRSSRA